MSDLLTQKVSLGVDGGGGASTHTLHTAKGGLAMATLLERLLQKAGEKAAARGLNTRIEPARRELTPKEEAELERWLERAQAKERVGK